MKLDELALILRIDWLEGILGMTAHSQDHKIILKLLIRLDLGPSCGYETVKLGSDRERTPRLDSPEIRQATVGFSEPGTRCAADVLQDSTL